MHVLWDYRVVLDLFLGGVGVGAFLLATILFFIDAKKYASMIKKSWIISPVLIIIGLLLLLTELGRPLNVIKAVFYTNFSSVMSIGMFLQGICVGLMLLLVLKVFTSKVEEVSKTLVILATAFAGMVGIYHGFLLTGIERTAWTDVIPSVFFISSMLAGAALVVMVNLNDEEFVGLSQKVKLPLVFNIFLTLQIITVFSWVYSLALRGLDTKQVYLQLMNSFSGELFLFLLIGIVLPLLMFSSMLMKKLYSKGLYVTACFSLIVGSVVLKYIVVYLGQMV